MLLTTLMMTLALTGAPASDQDGVVATARETPVVLDAHAAHPVAPPVGAAAQTAAPHGLTTDQQIERWLSDRDPTAEPFSEAYVDDRKVHGVVDVGVGTDGFRSYGAAVSMPIGESGRLDLSFRQVENGYPYDYGYGYGYGGPAYAAPGYKAYAPAGYEPSAGRPETLPGFRRPSTRLVE